MRNNLPECGMCLLMACISATHFILNSKKSVGYKPSRNPRKHSILQVICPQSLYQSIRESRLSHTTGRIPLGIPS